jgi:integrase/recombinase XerC
MSELGAHIERFLDELRRQNASPHTITAYGSDLRDFEAYFTPSDAAPPDARSFDLLSLREWLAALHERGAQPVTIRRKVAALRMFFRFLMRENLVAANPARLLHLPKMPQRLPSSPDAEQTSALIDAVATRKIGERSSARSRNAI